MSEEQTKRLKLMRTWLVGTFIIVAAAVALYGGFFTGLAILGQPGYWLIVGITGGLAIGVYYIERWRLTRP